MRNGTDGLGRHFPDVLGNAHAAKLGATHRTKSCCLERFLGKSLIMKCSSGFRIQGELELAVPIKIEARTRQFIVAASGVLASPGNVTGMSGNLVGNNAL